MAKLKDLETPSNLYLFNLLFRHQVYLEGVKAGFAQNYKAMLRQLYGEFAKYAGMTRYDNLDEFTRLELQMFIQRFAVAQQHFYSRYTQKLIELLQAFVSADVEVTRGIYEAATGKTTEQRHASPEPTDKPSTHGLTPTQDTATGNKALWNSIEKAIVPANGMTIPQMLDAFEKNSTSKVLLAINRGYANNETVKETLASIVGNSDANFRDGLFATFNAQNATILATILQHVSSISQAAIASIHFNQYQWVSMLDSRTTEICLSRNGNVYTYGEGPLPPAHYNCRSKAVSLVEGDSELHDIPPTYNAWLQTQPSELLSDMLGTTLAAQIIANSNKVKDISINESVIPLTIDQFRAKIDFITM